MALGEFEIRNDETSLHFRGPFGMFYTNSSLWVLMLIYFLSCYLCGEWEFPNAMRGWYVYLRATYCYCYRMKCLRVVSFLWFNISKPKAAFSPLSSTKPLCHSSPWLMWLSVKSTILAYDWFTNAVTRPEDSFQSILYFRANNHLPQPYRADYLQQLSSTETDKIVRAHLWM